MQVAQLGGSTLTQAELAALLVSASDNGAINLTELTGAMSGLSTAAK